MHYIWKSGDDGTEEMDEGWTDDSGDNGNIENDDDDDDDGDFANIEDDEWMNEYFITL